MDATAEAPALDVPGWSTGLERLYREMVQALPEGASFVEVGCWQGRSIILAALEARRLGKALAFVAVDHFRGSQEHQDEVIVRNGRLRQALEDNLAARGLADVVLIEEGESVTVADQFHDEGLDFVFLDASHDFESLSADIRAWLPKVKAGGTLAGHDWHGWPDVRRAVQQEIGRAVEIVEDCWVYRKVEVAPVSAAPPLAWEYKAVGVPCATDFEAVAPLFDKLGLEGWELATHLTKEVSAPEVPAGLLGPAVPPKREGAAVLLATARNGANKFILVDYLIFKRRRAS